MKITDAGAELSPWRRRVLPVMMMALRAAVAWYVLRTPLYVLTQNPLFLKGVAPGWAQYALCVPLVAGGLAFIWSRSVVWGAMLAGAGLMLFEYCWRRVGQEPHGATLASSVSLLAVLAVGEWLARRVQRRVYGSVSR